MKFRRGMHDTVAILPPFPMAQRPRRNEDRRTRPATEGAECNLDTPRRYETAHPFPETSGDNRYPRLGAYCRPYAQPITRRWGKERDTHYGEHLTGVEAIDNEHKRIIEISNQIISDADFSNRNDKALVVEDFFNLLVSHFRNEEDDLINMDLNSFKVHKADHDMIASAISDVLSMMKSGIEIDANYHTRLCQIIMDFYSRHFSIADIPYIERFHSNHSGNASIHPFAAIGS